MKKLQDDVHVLASLFGIVPCVPASPDKSPDKLDAGILEEVQYLSQSHEARETAGINSSIRHAPGKYQKIQEKHVCDDFADILAEQGSVEIEKLRSNNLPQPYDFPDCFGELAGKCIGIEVTELTERTDDTQPWTSEWLEQELSRITKEKDEKATNPERRSLLKQLQELFLIIHTGIPDLDSARLQSFLSDLRLHKPRRITRVFVLGDYEPKDDPNGRETGKARYTVYEVPLTARIYKHPSTALGWLNRALEFEKEKNRQCPVLPDLVSEFVNAGGWGYVVAGYTLLEQSLKLLLRLTTQEEKYGHEIAPLFAGLSDPDKFILREYYEDLRLSHPTLGGYRLSTLDEFLEELDGEWGEGWKAWRYYLTERERFSLPHISIDYLHEVVFGVLQILEEVLHQHSARQSLYSQRRYRERFDKYLGWIGDRMNKPGWAELRDRIEVYGVYDRQGRTDFIIWQTINAEVKGCPQFGELPDDDNLPVVNMEKEARSALDKDWPFV